MARSPTSATLPGGTATTSARLARVGGERFALALLAVFFVVLLLSPVLRGLADSHWVDVFDVFYRVGALVFGGGHVVLPLLEAEVVQPGWVTPDQFTAGYGAAQAVPGPLFTFAAFLGATAGSEPNGWAGGSAALLAIFLPSFLLVWGALPFWNRLRGHAGVQAALRGVGAAVVGILLAALYDPIWTSAIFEPADVALALAAFGLIAAWRLPPWVVVVFCASGGQLLAWV